MHTNYTSRHIGLSEEDKKIMLADLGLSSMEQLIDNVIPQDIRFEKGLDIPEGINENFAIEQLRATFAKVENSISLIGQGYYNCHTPSVIRRNMLENPGWYTSYTPYQAEISQGRLEMLFNFQTLVAELTGLPIANSSLLDEGTAIAEAVVIAVNAHRGKRNKVVSLNPLFRQNLNVLKTRCQHLNIDLLKCKKQDKNTQVDEQTAAIILQYPDRNGARNTYPKIIEQAKKHKALVIVVADPMALLLTKPPAQWGADIVVGSMQRFGIPMGNGGPHAAYIAVTEKLTRLVPGRIVGQSIDADGNPSYRLALQTREQHIRREKANSNICTAQALLANMSAAFAIWHGPARLLRIARRIHNYTKIFAKTIEKSLDYKLGNEDFFDTLLIITKRRAHNLQSLAEDQKILIRFVDKKRITVSFDETTNENTLGKLAKVFDLELASIEEVDEVTLEQVQQNRGDEFLSQEVFNQYHNETAMMRYLRELVDKDYALDRGMIPLGSCTMKLNASAEMLPITWSKVANLHPLSPAKYHQAYDSMIKDLDKWLCSITGFSKVSFQPNSGSQGEYAGLVAIKAYHQSQNQECRTICLIPSSAHGTNPASANIAGLDIVVVECDNQGNVDIDDLQKKAEQYSDKLAALMITYPSTHGVFELQIKKICEIIHNNGGQVYLDGANLNALVGLARPADIGADVCHINLHKTFCIPHGGGGPGVGPIGVAAHLKPFLPTLYNTPGIRISSAPYGSASILPISWMYIRMLGRDGLKNATECAILSANYLAKHLNEIFPVLYTGEKGFVAHECIVDTRDCKQTAGVSVDDIAKRLMDYGFHAPTMSWPVIGTLMIEPTESEPKKELDRFIKAMCHIQEEIKQIEQGKWQQDNNPLVNAPHTMEKVLSSNYDFPYSREVASALAHTQGNKYWPPVSRVDNVYGDRNLSCSCPPMDQYR
jgi:glycine dehydrogenase